MARKRGAQPGQGRRNRAVFHAQRMWPCKNVTGRYRYGAKKGQDKACGMISVNRFNCPACLEKLTDEYELPVVSNGGVV